MTPVPSTMFGLLWRASFHYLAYQKAAARQHPRLLQRLAGGSVGAVAACRRDLADLVREPLQLLDHVASEAALPVQFGDSHVEIAVGRVIVERYASCRHWDALALDHPVTARIELL